MYGHAMPAATTCLFWSRNWLGMRLTTAAKLITYWRQAAPLGATRRATRISCTTKDAKPCAWGRYRAGPSDQQVAIATTIYSAVGPLLRLCGECWTGNRLERSRKFLLEYENDEPRCHH
jgi:hypothetical protein